MDNDKICPLCGGDNGCKSGSENCWCYYTDIPDGIFKLIPEEKRGKACICLECVEKFKRSEAEKMFREMSKENMHMDKEEIMEILSEAEYGIISTIGENGYPYGFPMSHKVLNSNIYFHCGVNGHKIDNLNFNNKVSYTVVGETKLVPELQDTDYKSVIAFGEAVLVEGSEKTKVLKEIVDKYAPGFEEIGYKSIGPEYDIVKVYRIEIEYITGKERKDGKR